MSKAAAYRTEKVFASCLTNESVKLHSQTMPRKTNKANKTKSPNEKGYHIHSYKTEKASWN